MRKMTSGLLVAVLVVLVAGAAWAAGGPPASLPAAAQERAQQFQQAMHQFRDNLQAMNENRMVIREMQGEIRDLAQGLRETVQDILEEGVPMTEDQLAKIRKMTQEMRGYGRSLGATIGQVREQLGLMRQARTALQSGLAINAYQRIQEVQEDRLNEMARLKSAIQSLLKELNGTE